MTKWSELGTEFGGVPLDSCLERHGLAGVPADGRLRDFDQLAVVIPAAGL